MKTLYECADVTFRYRLGRQDVVALHGVDLHIPQGGFTCLSGPSGSGKSTLLNLLGLIEPPQAGRLVFAGRDLAQLSEAERNHVRRHQLAFVFQSFHLIESLRADENVEYFLARQGVSRSERRERVDAALRQVGLWDRRKQKPLELSGGQRQRVAIARALAKRPQVIIADEPTASLDQATGSEIMALLRELNETQGVAVVLSSHDPMVVAHAKQVVHLVDGRIVQATGERVRHAG